MTTRLLDQATIQPSDQAATRPPDQVITRPLDQVTIRLDDYMPLSMLNQLEYCERRFYLMHVCGEMEINAAVLDGTQLHERTHTAGAAQEGETTVHRKVYVWSDRLRIAGYADLVEEVWEEGVTGRQGDKVTGGQGDKETGRQGDKETGGQGDQATIRPIEYKRGKMGKWLNDHVQLCAQAMCLEERLTTNDLSRLTNDEWPTTVERQTAQRIEKGCLFYFGSRRREEVSFTPELRAQTEAAVQRAFELVAAGVLPLPTDKRAKCRDCSLEPVCLPFESDVWSGRRIVR